MVVCINGEIILQVGSTSDRRGPVSDVRDCVMSLSDAVDRPNRTVCRRRPHTTSATRNASILCTGYEYQAKFDIKVSR